MTIITTAGRNNRVYLIKVVPICTLKSKSILLWQSYPQIMLCKLKWKLPVIKYYCKFCYDVLLELLNWHFGLNYCISKAKILFSNYINTTITNRLLENTEYSYTSSELQLQVLSQDFLFDSKVGKHWPSSFTIST